MKERFIVLYCAVAQSRGNRNNGVMSVTIA